MGGAAAGFGLWSSDWPKNAEKKMQGMAIISAQGLADYVGRKRFPVRRIDRFRPFVQEQRPTLPDLPDVLGKNGQPRTQAQGPCIHRQVAHKGIPRFQEDADGTDGNGREWEGPCPEFRSPQAKRLGLRGRYRPPRPGYPPMADTSS